MERRMYGRLSLVTVVIRCVCVCWAGLGWLNMLMYSASDTLSKTVNQRRKISIIRKTE